MTFNAFYSLAAGFAVTTETVVGWKETEERVYSTKANKKKLSDEEEYAEKLLNWYSLR